MKHFKFKDVGHLFGTTFKKWFARDPFRESAVIAYNAIFSLPGLLVVVIAVSGYFFGKDAITGHLHTQIAGAMGNDTALEIEQMVTFASKSKDSVWASIFAIVTIFVGATGVFVEMQQTLNEIWEVKANAEKSGFLLMLKTRLFSFGLIITIAFLLLISLTLSSLLSALSAWVLQHWSDNWLLLFQIINFVFPLGVITVLFAMLFKILPDAKIKWHLVWIGAFLTSLLFTLGKSALGLYFGKAEPGSGYGTAGSVVLIMLWTSYSSMIVFFGAEFTKVYSDLYYGEVPAAETAVKEKPR